MLTKHHDLWARMLVHKHEEYPLALRLVAISLLIPTDTSECERIFSLMNDIKTAERSRMGTQVLKNLMIWHRSARKLEEDGSLSSKHMSCYEVPVMQIVQEFRNMAGVKGRKAHRAWPIPSYDYEKGRTNAAKEAAEKEAAAEAAAIKKAADANKAAAAKAAEAAASRAKNDAADEEMHKNEARAAAMEAEDMAQAA